MKILLDENIDVRFKNLFNTTVHKVFTIRDMNWLGIKNGELLKLLEANHFDVFIAVDKNLPYQQNKEMLPVLIIILNVKRNVLQRISAQYPKILELISKPIQKEIIVLNEL
jgi:hypothetical protein